MAKVDELLVEIKGNISDLESKLSTAVDVTEKSSKKMGGAFEHLNNKLGKVVTGFGAFGLAVEGAAKALAPFQLALEKIQGAQGLVIASKRLGVTTKRMQELGFAARMMGADSEMLADAMKDLTVKIKDASLGATSYEEALNLVGLKSQELVNMSPDQQFLKFADAISKADSATRRFVLDEINDAMFQLLPLMEKGAAGFEKMAQRANELNAVLSETELEKLNEAAMKINEMNSAWDAMITKITAKLAPAVTVLIKEVDALITSSTGGHTSRLAGFTTDPTGQATNGPPPRGSMGLPVGYGVTGGLTRDEEGKLFGEGFAMDGSMMTEQTGEGDDRYSREDAVQAAIEHQEELDAAVLEAKQRAQVLWIQNLRENMEEEKRIAKEKADAEIRIEKMKQAAKKSILKDLSSLMNTESRKVFEIGKAAAIAQTTMSTYQSVTKAMAEVPYPLNFGVAAAALAAGLNNVNNIRNTSFGSAGGGAASTGGIAGGAGGVGQQTEIVERTDVNVNLVGDNFGGDGVVNLIDRLNDAVGDGVTLRATQLG